MRMCTRDCYVPFVSFFLGGVISVSFALCFFGLCQVAEYDGAVMRACEQACICRACLHMPSLPAYAELGCI